MRNQCVKKSRVLLWVMAIQLTGLSLQAQEKLYPNEFPLGDVRLLEGIFKHSRDLNIHTLLVYDVDRLLASYRKEAGLPEIAKGFSNWDGLDGHVAGHYLSALAINYAATGDKECKQRMDYIIAQLKDCQHANALLHPDWGMGYVGAVPNGKALWPKIKSGEVNVIWGYWVPWYNIHKTYAGLRDAWLYADNEEAKIIFVKFCDWAINITAGLSDLQMEEMLGSEHGGMNEIFADAFQITADKKYLDAAKRFSHKVLLEPMAAQMDNLDNKHANTQIPKAIGFARIAELIQGEKYSKACHFFWETIVANRTLAFGGNSRREHFPGAAACSDYINEVEGPETCNTYNMLKLTENLFRVSPAAKYADYYERALYNHILSTQHPAHGGYVYFTPARPRHYRVYSSPNKAMWCCVGTGMENHGKYNQFIYTHKNDSLFVNLFISSELNWKEKGIKIKQETQFPYTEQTRLVVTSGNSEFKLLVRFPSWVKEGTLKIYVNGKSVAYNARPSSYVSIDRYWETGDEVKILLPMLNTIEHIPNLPNYIALLHGPILLGAKTGTEDMVGLIASEERWGHIAFGPRLPLDKAPVIRATNTSDVTKKLKAVKGKPLVFTIAGLKAVNGAKQELEPFFSIHDARYSIYWMTLTNEHYHAYLDSLKIDEKEKMQLQNRTIDFVAPGEQQPEADHVMQAQNSNSGNAHDAFWRDANNGGYFSYYMATHAETGLSLSVRYHGADLGAGKFDIYIDDEKLLTEDRASHPNQPGFFNVEYVIPDSMVKGKERIGVMFRAVDNHATGAIYYVRLVRKKCDQ